MVFNLAKHATRFIASSNVVEDVTPLHRCIHVWSTARNRHCFVCSLCFGCFPLSCWTIPLPVSSNVIHLKKKKKKTKYFDHFSRSLCPCFIVSVSFDILIFLRSVWKQNLSCLVAGKVGRLIQDVVKYIWFSSPLSSSLFSSAPSYNGVYISSNIFTRVFSLHCLLIPS